MSKKVKDAPKHGRPGPARALNEKQAAEVRRLRAEGCSWAQVAKYLGCSIGAARGALRAKKGECS